jgi:hypothetical protein
LENWITKNKEKFNSNPSDSSLMLYPEIIKKLDKKLYSDFLDWLMKDKFDLKNTTHEMLFNRLGLSIENCLIKKLVDGIINEDIKSWENFLKEFTSNFHITVKYKILNFRYKTFELNKDDFLFIKFEELSNEYCLTIKIKDNINRPDNDGLFRAYPKIR